MIDIVNGWCEFPPLAKAKMLIFSLQLNSQYAEFQN